MSSEISGVIPAVITPFDASGAIDTDALMRYLDRLNGRVDGYFLCGSYGSGPLMNEAERRAVAETARQVIQPSTPMIVHVGAPDTRTTISLARHAQSIGATAVAAVSPYYYRHSESEIRSFYKALVTSVEIPVIAYNNPKYSNYSISPRLLKQLHEVGLSGVKDSSGDIGLFYAYLEAIPGGAFTFLIGSQTLLLPALLMGGHGCVSGLSNAFPELIRRVYSAWLDGNREAAVEAQRQANQLRRLTGDGIPIPFYHAVLPMLGIEIGIPRPPMDPLDSSRLKEIHDELTAMGMLERDTAAANAGGNKAPHRS